ECDRRLHFSRTKDSRRAVGRWKTKAIVVCLLKRQRRKTNGISILCDKQSTEDIQLIAYQ
ncbi:MAG: hypothetical protein AAFO84_15740, partial [Cyanobacteria bacterium J06598_1]